VQDRFALWVDWANRSARTAHRQNCSRTATKFLTADFTDCTDQEPDSIRVIRGQFLGCGFAAPRSLWLANRRFEVNR